MKESSQTLWVGLSFLAVGLAFGLLISNLSSNGSVSIPGLPEENNGLEIEFVGSVSADDDAFLGDADAPVTIVEFSDFQCPYCANFVTQTLDALKEKYIDTGLVKLVYRDFPLSIHPNAPITAQAAECVGEEAGNEAYFKMHDALFAQQSVWSSMENPLDYLVELAADTTKTDIRSCLENNEMMEEVNADFAAGRSYGVSGTPTFFINGKKLVGAYPIDIISQLIEEEL